MDEFIKIIPSTFRPFIGYHQGLLACIIVEYSDTFACQYSGELQGHVF